MKKISANTVVFLFAFTLLASTAWAALSQTQVSQLYVSIFGRASEGEGNAYWCSNQSDMVTAADTMLNTDPAKSYFGATLNDNQLFIEFIYGNTLGKTYAEDPNGVDYWVSELANGKTKGQVVAALINAAIDPQYAGLPAQNQFLNKVAVCNYCADMIATCPDVNDLSAFVEYIEHVTDNSATVMASKALINVTRTYKTAVINDNVWEYRTSERNPDYEYAGQWYQGAVVSFFPSGHTVFDFWKDGDLDILVPINKGYATGIDTRFTPLLFKNNGTSFTESGSEVIGEIPAIPGLRRVEIFSDTLSGVSGIFGVAHDTGDTNSADALLLTAGSVPENKTSSLPRLPLADTVGRSNAVDAHSLASGDLTGNGLTDFIVGEWRWTGGPYKLIQQTAGSWIVSEDSFLKNLTQQPMVNSESGDGRNLLLDLHLADLNGDGYADLVAGWGHGSTYSHIFLNDGTGGFSKDQQKQLPQSVYGIDNDLHMKTMDLDADGDGDRDLLIIHSRYEPYYGGYSLQLLNNDGKGGFTDVTDTSLSCISGRERTFSDRLQWSDNFYLMDINQDGFTDIVGSDFDGVRLWINNGQGQFIEVEVDTLDQHKGGTFIFVDMGAGRTSSLVFRQGWTDAEGTENRMWFEQVDLIPK